MAIDRDDLIRLIDMRDSIGEIVEYAGGADFNTFFQRVDMREAVSAQLGQIGGAAALLTDEFKEEVGDFDWDVFKGLQYVASDEYFEKDLHGIWFIISNDFPVFYSKLSDMVTTYQDDMDIEGFALNQEDARDIKNRFKNREAAKEERTGPDNRIKDPTKQPQS
jgi:uncharacterized protein with HEPN domain